MVTNPRVVNILLEYTLTPSTGLVRETSKHLHKFGARNKYILIKKGLIFALVVSLCN